MQADSPRRGPRREAAGGRRGAQPGRQSARILSGAEREKLAEQLAARYHQGESLRELAADTGASFGFVRSLLLKHGVELRARGGNRSRSRSSTRPDPDDPS